MEKEKKPAAMHSGHRDRLRKRYAQTGFDGFAEHEILEYILMQVIPRQDLNPLAHSLIDRFLSLGGVLDATVEELVTVPGIGEKTARYLHLLPSMFRAYSLSKVNPLPRLNSLDAVGPYVQALFVGETTEKIYMLSLDNADHLLHCHLIGEGTVNHVNANIRKIVELAIRDNAAAVILAHNHPHGLAVPSRDDNQVTASLSEALRLLDIPLLDHIVVSDFSYSPIMGRLKPGGHT